jgi:hypothetical protein
MDLITSKYFKKFLEEMQISGGPNDRNFEKFINYIILSSKNINNFNLSSVTTGDGGDCAIDGLAISINNKYVANSSELKDLLDLGMEFSVELYFIQSKTSEKFDGSEILQFGNGVCDVLKDSETVATKKRNDKIEEKAKMIQILFDHYEFFSNPPKCYLYYVTTGVWVNDQNLSCDVTKVCNDLKSLNIFDPDIKFQPYGSNEIRQQFESTKMQNSSTFELKEKVEIPFMDSIIESYLAVMPITDYLNIVLDDNKQIKKGIFELNVRDFAGLETNRVNQDIEDTIHNDKDKFYFGLLNNGITIVGKSLNKGRGKYTIKNFYIVNGCQTTNILCKNMDSIDKNMWISVKIVITEDDEIIKKIVKATNNQTEVEEIQLLSMSEYQEKLESFYNNYDEIYQLYYERRSGQYNYDNNIDKSRIISPEIQMRAFASIFLEVPNRASRFYGTLREDIDKKRIFVNGHKPIMYYASGLLHHQLEKCFNNDMIANVYYKFKYHLMMIIAKNIWKGEVRPQLNSRKMDDYCLMLINKIADNTEFEKVLESSIQAINKVIVKIDDLDANKSGAYVNDLLMYVDIGITRSGYRDMISFNNVMDLSLNPFYNMTIDGDMRYKFEDRLEELIGKLRHFGMKKTVEILQSYLLEVDEESRESRKEYAEKIYIKINQICDDCREKIDKAKRYIDNSELIL